MGALSSQASSERGEWRRQDAGGGGRAQEGGEGGGGRPTPVFSVPHPPPPGGICPSSWAHNPLGRCHYSSPPETQQPFRNRSFTLMPNPGVLATLSLAVSNPLFFRCLYLLLLVTTISRMTATPPTPGSASLVFTHPQLPFKGQPVCIPFRRTHPWAFAHALPSVRSTIPSLHPSNGYSTSGFVQTPSLGGCPGCPERVGCWLCVGPLQSVPKDPLL